MKCLTMTHVYVLTNEIQENSGQEISYWKISQTS